MRLHAHKWHPKRWQEVLHMSAGREWKRTTDVYLTCSRCDARKIITVEGKLAQAEFLYPTVRQDPHSIRKQPYD